MREIDSLEELKKIQLDILLALHQFCIDNQIKYSLAAGTLIGAVRHKGFIPWDDDIDIYLMREEYNKLISLFPIVYQDNYSLITIERDNKWYCAFGKLCDNRTIKIEETRNRYNEIGLGIDIFPIDDVPDDVNEWKCYERKRRFIRDAIAIKTITYSKNRSLGKNLFMILCRFVMWPFSFAFLSRKMNRFAQLHNGKEYNHVYENSLGVYNSEHPWLKKDLEEVIEATFNGHTVKIMQGYDDYLTTVYGDYMQLPPVEKRVTHHGFKAYWK